jgi:hypothetical protein
MTAFQKISDVGPHLVKRMRAFFGQRRKVFHPVIVHARQPGAASANFFVVAFHGAVRIEVVFDNGDADLARGLDRLPYLLDLLVSIRAP